MMPEATLALPKMVPVQKVRPPKENIPQTKLERDQILEVVRDYMEEKKLVPPLSFGELRAHSDSVVQRANTNQKYKDYVAILVNNETWRESLASVPYQKRLLLLPKCLRVEAKCPAPFDEFGLLCKRCGLCSIQDLQEEAERLGYAVLVAEGSPLVMQIIQTGKIEAIVGVSCLSVLEKTFPYMEAAAIPGVAIPLLNDDCIDTTVDLDWVWDVIHLTSDDKTHRLDLDALRTEVDSWFSSQSLSNILGTPTNPTQEIACQWLSCAGKRWRPFLTVCVFKACQQDPEGSIPEDLKKIAVAVECFHKASLIHDDIEDDDPSRYGEKTLHQEYGIPLALNIGDFLIGEGYRLIAETQISSTIKTEMLRVAALGHRTLCLGQGAELSWARKPTPLSSLEVLNIFRQKTAPAFEVALRLGTLFADTHYDVGEVLTQYSESLGIAYQIRDDLQDFFDNNDSGDIKAMRPSVLLALGYERAKEDAKNLLRLVWQRAIPYEEAKEEIEKIIRTLEVEKRAQRLLDSYKEEAVRSLRSLENATLKGLLRRVMGKIFNDLEIKGWCHEFEARNVAGRQALTETIA